MVIGGVGAPWRDISLGRSGVGRWLHGWRQSNTGSAERKAGGGTPVGTDKEALSVLLDLGERVETGEDLGPQAAARMLGGPLRPGDAIFELGFEDESEEGAEDVAADGLVELIATCSAASSQRQPLERIGAAIASTQAPPRRRRRPSPTVSATSC